MRDNGDLEQINGSQWRQNEVGHNSEGSIY